MSNLVVRFAIRICRRTVGLEGETTLDLVGNGQGGLLHVKRLRRTGQ